MMWKAARLAQTPLMLLTIHLISTMQSATLANRLLISLCQAHTKSGTIETECAATYASRLTTDVTSKSKDHSMLSASHSKQILAKELKFLHLTTSESTKSVLMTSSWMMRQTLLKLSFTTMNSKWRKLK